ncbi:MAG: TIGR02147 family protein [Fibrobacterota bacterium]|nr:TIGR02147 family protein [Fibrobacterota bacterium]QQS06892.1 MAG: TIGR02147 family protein [Fibrobacterota bacterium]
MKPVFEYLDYRAYLKDAYEERKAESSFYSYRMMAESFGLFPSNIFRILHSEAHLPARCHSRALEFLGLSGRAAEYYLLLMAYARERSVHERTLILEKAMTLRDVARRPLESKELEYFAKWWTAVLRSLLETTGGRAVPSELAKALVPPVTEAEVQESLTLLTELGLVKKASSGRLLPAEAHLTAGGEAKAHAVRGFQRQILTLASTALEQIPPDQRDISTLTLSMDENAFREIRELVRECRRQIQKRVEESRNSDRVMHLAMAFFPAALIPGSKP